MDDVIEFGRRLMGRIREEIPDLRMIMAVYDQRSWRDCRMALARYIEERFGADAETIAADLRHPRASGETAAYGKYMAAGGEKALTRIFMINADQARLCHPGAPETVMKGMIAHEAGHIVSKHKRNMYFALPPAQEEGLADLFNVAVMANEGHAGHGADVAAYRLRSPFLPETLFIRQPDHPLPALADEAAELAQLYSGKARGDFSVRDLKAQAESLVSGKARRIALWEEFGRTAMALGERGVKACDILACARDAGSPFVSVVERYSGITASETAPAGSNPFLAPAEKMTGVLEDRHRLAYQRKVDAAPPWYGYTIIEDRQTIADRRIGL